MKNATIYDDFDQARYALSAFAVQQCLAEEPALAVALSTLKPSVAYFKRYLKDLVKAAGVVANGAAFESIVFGALQLASAKNNAQGQVKRFDTFATQNLYVTLKRVHELITAHPRRPNDDVFETVYVKGTNQAQSRQNKGSNDSTEALKKMKMPWLVPACGYKQLYDTLEKYPDFFEGLDGVRVHGLVFTGRNDPFDLLVINRSKQVFMAVECRIRGGEYNQGRFDLLDKKKQRFNEMKKTKELHEGKEIDYQYHVLLIVQEASERCLIEYKVKDGDYLEVVLIVGANSEWKPKVTRVEDNESNSEETRVEDNESNSEESNSEESN